MKKKILISYISVIFAALLHSHVHAQVTIGAAEPPAVGSILQLKSITGVTNGAANATGGLIMPRVQLVDSATLQPMYSYADAANTPSAADKQAHTGLMVYNVTPTGTYCPAVPKGLYVWNGESWDGVSNPLGTVTGISGTVYKTRRFGAAGEWMIENLRETAYDTGETGTITEGGFQTNIAAQTYYYPKNTTYTGIPSQDRVLFDSHPEYGLIYTWGGASNNKVTDNIVPTVAGTTPSTVQGICPAGWKLPSDYDWSQLEKEIADNPTLYSNTPAGTTAWDPAWASTVASRGSFSRSMKSCTQVASIAIPPNGASLPTGFSVLLVGYMTTIGGGTGGYGLFSHLWSSTKDVTDSNKVLTRSFVFSLTGVSRDSTVIQTLTLGSINNQFSVRCKR